MKMKTWDNACHVEDDDIEEWIRFGLKCLADNPNQTQCSSLSGDCLVYITRAGDSMLGEERFSVYITRIERAAFLATKEEILDF